MMAKCILLTVVSLTLPTTVAAVLFDFDSGPIHASLPIDQTAAGITAHLAATGQGYSIQSVDVQGFTPAGFSGLCLCPNSVFAADLLVAFSATITEFSLLFSPQELGCDDSATIRVTAYLDDVLVGTSTATASPPGTWPTGTAAFNAPAGFNHVVVHYDARPPTCQDWGPILMADNMNVTPKVVAVEPRTWAQVKGLFANSSRP